MRLLRVQKGKDVTMKKTEVVANVLAGVMVASVGFGLAGLVSGCATTEAGTSCCGCGGKKESVQMKSSDFYKDGKFDAAKAKQAYFDLMAKFNVPVYAALKKDDGFFWAVDFGKGDFTKYGMAGVFWCNEKKEGYFGHEIYLLPNQSIPEHRHLPTTDKAGNKIPPDLPA